MAHGVARGLFFCPCRGTTSGGIAKLDRERLRRNTPATLRPLFIPLFYVKNFVPLYP